MVPSPHMKRGTKMSVMMIVGLAVVGLLMLLVIPALVNKSIAPGLEKRIAKLYPADKVVLQDLKALSFGLESKGVTQSRGNGALVLTANEVHWFQFAPEIDIRIPRASITKVDTVTTHLGKSLGKDVLYVAFTVDGKPDSMAWNVMDLNAWLTALKQPATGSMVK